MSILQPYESEAVRAVTGPTIRPGGLTLTRRAAEACGLGPGHRVLDVGCGTGATMTFLRDHCGAAVIGVDFSPILLSAACRENSGLTVIQADAMALPLKPDTFNAVLAECVCSLLPDAQAALNGFYRVLRPGGHLVVADLYWRMREKAMAVQSMATVGGCLAGAVDRRTLIRRIKAGRFEVDLWEDHSDKLKQLAAQLAWAGVSLTDWWGIDCASGTCNSGERPGYCLIIAHKEKETNG